MEDNQKKILMLVIGGGLLVAIVYYFFVKPQGGQPKLLSGSAPSRPPQASTPTTTVVQQPVYISGGGFSGVSSNLYIRRGAWSSETSRLQAHLNKGASKSYGGTRVSLLTVDGLFGDKTLARISPQFPSIGRAANQNGGLSRAEFDTIMNTSMTSSSSAPSAPAGGSTSSGGGCTNIDVVTATSVQLSTYIRCKTGASTVNWYTSALREWARAIQQNKSSFRCTQCYTTGTYSTRTGLRM